MSTTKKILGFRWSRKFKITLEAICLWQNISISIFKFSPFIYKMKACQWNCLDKEREKTLVQQSMRKEKMRKVGLCFCFIKSFNMTIIWQLFFLFRKLIRSPIFAFWFQDDARNMKMGSRKQQIARNGKLQYLFKK